MERDGLERLGSERERECVTPTISMQEGQSSKPMLFVSVAVEELRLELLFTDGREGRGREGPREVRYEAGG